jgi:hypothetical protein
MKVVPLRLGPGDDLRLAGATEATSIHGGLEILSLSGTLSPDGSHLHTAVADSRGAVIGLLQEWRFSRELDPATGYVVLQISPRDRS